MRRQKLIAFSQTSEVGEGGQSAVEDYRFIRTLRRGCTLPRQENCRCLLKGSRRLLASSRGLHEETHHEVSATEHAVRQQLNRPPQGCCNSAHGVYRAAPAPSQNGQMLLSDRTGAERTEKCFSDASSRSHRD